jgi:hypothetical protein
VGLGDYGDASNFLASAGACGPAPAPSSVIEPVPGAGEIAPAGIAAAAQAAAGLGSPLPATSVVSQTVALGFGSDEQSALSAALGSSATPFAATFAFYQQQWLAYDANLCPPAGLSLAPAALAKLDDAYWLSANVIKASEDKAFLGATVASLASPWGQSVPAGNPVNNLAPYFGSYREVFPRDAYETFTGFMADGDLTTARAMVHYWFDDMQLPNGSFPRNGLLNGKAAPDTGGLQLDETADPILAAWMAGLAGDTSVYEQHIKPAADFLVANGPETPGSVERWEEQTGYSPSTMADEVAALVAAAAIAATQGDGASERLFLATADNFRRLIFTTTVTSNGPLSPSPYFIRVDKTGDLGLGSLLDQPSVVAARYLASPPGEVPLTVTSPLTVSGGNIPVDMARPNVTVDSPELTVAATTQPGATVDVAVTGAQLGASSPTTTITTATAGTDGNVTVPVEIEPGTDSVEVAVTDPSGTNEALFTVENLLVPGTVVLSVAGPADGGYGPGTYAYPTAATQTARRSSRLMPSS